MIKFVATFSLIALVTLILALDSKAADLTNNQLQNCLSANILSDVSLGGEVLNEDLNGRLLLGNSGTRLLTADRLSNRLSGLVRLSLKRSLMVSGLQDLSNEGFLQGRLQLLNANGLLNNKLLNLDPANLDLVNLLDRSALTDLSLNLSGEDSDSLGLTLV